jgi:mycothiol system anti-sigma-R factor
MTDAFSHATAAGTLNCREAMAILWDHLDGELSPEREAAMRWHLEICRPCLEHHRFERAFLDAVAAARDADPASPALRQRVIDALRSQGLLP